MTSTALIEGLNSTANRSVVQTPTEGGTGCDTCFKGNNPEPTYLGDEHRTNSLNAVVDHDGDSRPR